ncbi:MULTISPECIES: non-homologous end-joining DNA ligase [unclassified Luteococcus]|uniref:non-homologous end-joining DNA ligase n=1 Tax=unclassified Luteococcus TaxID=2639923 RepID=UPI00313EE7B7
MTSLTTEVDGRPVNLTNLDRQLFDSGFTKAEVIDYQLRIAPVMLPHLLGRCLTRKRFPQGASADSFYEKNLPAGAPEWVVTQQVDASDVPITYPLADSSATLVWLANLAALELHTPQWRIDDLAGGPVAAEHPIRLDSTGLVRSNRLVVDLDPGPGTSIVDSCRAAMVVATELAGDGLIPFVKTSGNKGLQVFAPIQPTDWRLVVEHVRRLAVRLARRHPDTFVAVMAKDQRPGRVFVDYLQNQAARNTIAPYSLRARPFESVSTPLTWEEVAAVDAVDALQFRADDVLARVAHHGDLWADLLDPANAAPLPSPPSADSVN